MVVNLNHLLGMHLKDGRKMIEASDFRGNIIVRELVSPKHSGVKSMDVCRIVSTNTDGNDIILTVSYF